MALTDTFVKQVRWGTVRKSEEKRLDSDGMHLLVKAGVKYWRISLTPLGQAKDAGDGCVPQRDAAQVPQAPRPCS